MAVDLTDFFTTKDFRSDRDPPLGEILSFVFQAIGAEDYDIKGRLTLFEALIEYVLGRRLFLNPHFRQQKNIPLSTNISSPDQSIIYVLVVEQNKQNIASLIHLFDSDPRLMAIGAEGSSKEYARTAESITPDLIILDAGLLSAEDTTTCCACLAPLVVAVDWQALVKQKNAVLAQAFMIGAKAVLPKPFKLNHPVADWMAKEFVEAVTEIYYGK